VLDAWHSAVPSLLLGGWLACQGPTVQTHTGTSVDSVLIPGPGQLLLLSQLPASSPLNPRTTQRLVFPGDWHRRNKMADRSCWSSSKIRAIAGSDPPRPSGTTAPPSCSRIAGPSKTHVDASRKGWHTARASPAPRLSWERPGWIWRSVSHPVALSKVAQPWISLEESRRRQRTFSPNL